MVTALYIRLEVTARLSRQHVLSITNPVSL